MVDVGLKGGIITGGLGRPACQGMILNLPFQLACFVAPQPSSQVGGSIPLQPGEIGNLYQPVNPEFLADVDHVKFQDADGNFVDPSVYGKRQVKVKVTSRFFEGEKEFLIREKRLNTVFKIINLINTTRDKMAAAVTNIRNIATRAKIYVKNLRKHK